VNSELQLKRSVPQLKLGHGATEVKSLHKSFGPKMNKGQSENSSPFLIRTL
jgi:hypothetical protein